MELRSIRPSKARHGVKNSVASKSLSNRRCLVVTGGRSAGLFCFLHSVTDVKPDGRRFEAELTVIVDFGIMLRRLICVLLVGLSNYVAGVTTGLIQKNSVLKFDRTS
jgi:hypothetical protein